jgi:hypothetical protein
MDQELRSVFIDQLICKWNESEDRIRTIRVAAKSNKRSELVGTLARDLRRALRARRELERQLHDLDCPLFYAL